MECRTENCKYIIYIKWVLNTYYIYLHKKGIKYISINHNIYQAFIGCSVAAGIFAIFSSTFHIIFIALERTIAVYFPLTYHIIMTKNQRAVGITIGVVFIFHYSHCMCCRHQ